MRVSWTLSSLWDGFPALFLREMWPVNKSNLSPLRLVPFFAAVLVVAAWIGPQARFLRARAARPLVVAGQHSLEVFCLGIVLSALGHFVLAEFPHGIAMQLAVNAVGILAMLLFAGMIDWYKRMDRAPMVAAGGGAR